MVEPPLGDNPTPSNQSVIGCSLEPLGGVPASQHPWSVQGWVHWIGWLFTISLAGAGLAIGLMVGGSVFPPVLTVGGLVLGIWIHTRYLDPLAIRQSAGLPDKDSSDAVG
jgi:hypothetical protein